MTRLRFTAFPMTNGLALAASIALVAACAGCGAHPGMSVALPGLAGAMTVYVANSGTDTVTPIAVGRDKPGRPIKVGRGPEQILASPDGRTVFVASDPDKAGGAGPATLTAIDTATNKPSDIRTVCPDGHGGAAIAVAPDGRTVYFACAGANAVIPVRTGSMDLGAPIRVTDPSIIAVTPDGRTVYAADGGGDTITPISTATGAPGKPIKVGFGPAAIAITPDGNTAYVATYNGVVTPVEVATNKPGKPIKIEGATAITIAPDGQMAYVLSMPNPDSSQGYVVPIRVATNTTGTPVKVGVLPQQIAITPDSRLGYVTNAGSGTVTPIRLDKGTAENAIRVGNAGKAPAHLAITPDGASVYVVLSDPFAAAGAVVPIRIATNSVGRPISTGRFPFDIAITAGAR